MIRTFVQMSSFALFLASVAVSSSAQDLDTDPDGVENLVRIPPDLVGRSVFEVIQNSEINFVHDIGMHETWPNEPTIVAPGDGHPPNGVSYLLWHNAMCWSPANVMYYVTSSEPAPGTLVPVGAKMYLVSRREVLSYSQFMCSPHGVVE